MILGSAENERNFSGAVGRLPRIGQRGRVIEPVRCSLLRASPARSRHARGDLVPVGFVRRSLQYPSQSVRDRQPGRQTPGILPEQLVVVDRVAAIDRLALWQRATVAREVVVAVSLW